MNHRHAAALALLGWYLMEPPPLPDSVVVAVLALEHGARVES